MGLSVGIVGLPNVGKSTTFNALTKAQNAEAQNYPFCTIEPNKAVVSVPDDRIKVRPLAKRNKVKTLKRRLANTFKVIRRVGGLLRPRELG